MEQTPGGWSLYFDQVSKEAGKAFREATAAYVGVKFSAPLAYAHQTVAGTNYRFVCNGEMVTNPPQSGLYLVTVYEPLEGNPSVTEVRHIV